MSRKREYAQQAGETINHDDTLNRDTDGHLQYVHKAIAREITVQHTFNPLEVAPFLIGIKAAGKLIVGLNADLLDGLEATAFATAIHTHTKAQVTDLQPISATPAATTIPLADAAGKIALGWLLTGPGNGLDADTLDGKHASALATFEVAAVLGTL